MPSESRFWSDLRRKLGPGDFVRVENLCNPGTPDVSFCSLAIEGWIELKSRARPPLNRHGVRPSQKIWIRRRIAAGGLVLIVVGFGGHVYFVHGCCAETINSWTKLEFADYSLSSARRRDRIAVEHAFHHALNTYRRRKPAKSDLELV